MLLLSCSLLSCTNNENTNNNNTTKNNITISNNLTSSEYLSESSDDTGTPIIFDLGTILDANKCAYYYGYHNAFTLINDSYLSSNIKFIVNRLDDIFYEEFTIKINNSEYKTKVISIKNDYIHTEENVKYNYINDFYKDFVLTIEVDENVYSKIIFKNVNNNDKLDLIDFSKNNIRMINL